MQESTHIVFDEEEKKMIISTDIQIIFDFLINIEKEIEDLLYFEERINKIQQGYRELLGLSDYLVKELKDNNLNFTYNMKKPQDILQYFNFQIPIRSLFIVLFAHLETILCLYIVYDKEIDDEKKIIKESKGASLKTFINKFLLSDENEFYAKNKELFSQVSFSKFRNLRNSLTHFFSVGKISIIPKQLEHKSNSLLTELKKQTNFDSSFLSEEQLFLLIRGGAKLLLKSWSNDYMQDKEVFKRKIYFVKHLVETKAAVLIKGDDLNI